METTAFCPETRTLGLVKEVVMKIDIAQARKRAKELVKAGRAATLAEAQLQIARELGYSSWPALVHARQDSVPACEVCDQPQGAEPVLRFGGALSELFVHAACWVHVLNNPPLTEVGLTDEGRASKLTPRARHLWLGAETVAREFGHDYVGTEHMLLAIAREPDGIAGRALDELIGRDVLDAHLSELLASDEYNGRAAAPESPT